MDRAFMFTHPCVLQNNENYKSGLCRIKNQRRAGGKRDVSAIVKFILLLNRTRDGGNGTLYGDVRREEEKTHLKSPYTQNILLGFFVFVCVDNVSVLFMNVAGYDTSELTLFY